VKTIFDPSFRYTPSYGTDLRKTFERIRREQVGNIRDAAQSSEPAGEKVLPMRARQEGKK
jgi:hypothetical protein